MPFKATCPHCDATMTIMSPFKTTVPMAVSPEANAGYKPDAFHEAKNDIIRCDSCSNHSIVVGVQGDIVRVKGMNFSVIADPNRGRA